MVFWSVHLNKDFCLLCTLQPPVLVFMRRDSAHCTPHFSNSLLFVLIIRPKYTCTVSQAATQEEKKWYSTLAVCTKIFRTPNTVAKLSFVFFSPYALNQLWPQCWVCKAWFCWFVGPIWWLDPIMICYDFMVDFQGDLGHEPQAWADNFLHFLQ